MFMNIIVLLSELRWGAQSLHISERSVARSRNGPRGVAVLLPKGKSDPGTLSRGNHDGALPSEII